MPHVQNLDELETYLRKVMPQWKSIQGLRKNKKSGFIDFKWNGHHFAVKPSLEAFELKDNKLYITAGSLLLNSALLSRTGNEQKIAAACEVLEKAEDLVIARPEEGLSLVSSVKKTIQNMLHQQLRSASRASA